MKDNKKLVKLLTLPILQEIEEATISEVTELRITIVKYDELLTRIIREKINTPMLQ